MSFSGVLSYDSATQLNFNTTLVEVASSTLRLKDQGGGVYSTTPQLVTTQHQNTLTSLSSFAESSTLPANTITQYQLVLNGIAYWWNSTLAAWTTSDSTFATSNTPAVINSHASTLFSDLGLLVPQFLTLNIWLSTTVAGSRPVLTSNTIGYGWVNQNPTVINLVTVTGYLADLLGNNPLPTVGSPVNLLVSCDRAFFHGNHFVEPFTKSFAFNTSTGAVSASIIETATPGVKLNFSLSYYDGLSLRNTRLFAAIIPNQAAITLNNIATTLPVDFG